MTSPDWLDRSLYPFPSQFFDTGAGRIHYVDVGDGPTVLLVHGTPTWSFLYRRLIDRLREDYRVVAPDLLGFGGSEKPTTEAVAPPRQAGHLRGLVDYLGLDAYTLVVHDFGGPIGLSLALDRPSAVTQLVLFNTWMWRRTDAATRWASRFFGTRLGRWLYTRRNFSTDVMLPALTHRSLPPDVHAHYRRPFSTPEARHATWVFARDLAGAGDWYDDLWARREAIASIPALLLWGAKDPGFGVEARARWAGLFDAVHGEVLEDVGHLPQEEAPEVVADAVSSFLVRTDSGTRSLSRRANTEPK
jgi:haloalkane dehalogenase